MRFAATNGLQQIPGGSIVFDARAQLLGGLGSLPRVLLGLSGIWELVRLLGGVAVGRRFDPVARTRLRRFAWAMLAYTLLAPFEGAWHSFAFTVGNPPGSHAVDVRFGLSNSDCLSILLSAAILAMAVALPEAEGRAPGSQAPA